MANNLHLYNSLTRKKEKFEPVNPPFVGMYACGPTVYGEPHLGHARQAITYDIVFRFLKYLGYKVRYVRNITDVGHLEQDADAGEDRVSKKARLENIEPMEVVQKYSLKYHEATDLLNCLPPSIEPTASGHIIEQIQMVEKILEAGYAYESEGSVYFDVEKYNKDHNYGKLSGRVLEDLYSFTRELDGKHEKRNSFDFALWKKASPEHIMRWPSKWSEGFPGWHLECSAMSTKYLGEVFDIHGGGMDLLFPHHECEIAQSKIANDKDSVKYWIHNNMITINGQKMGKSLNNFINLDEFFTGDHEKLEQAYTPMTIRFFMLQAHYRSTLDFSNEALQAAEKGYSRLMNAIAVLKSIKPEEKSTISFNDIEKKCIEALEDDFNTPIALSHLFDGVRLINSINDGKETINSEELEKAKNLYIAVAFDIFGLKEENTSQNDTLLNDVVDMILNLRLEAKANKDFTTSDKIRDKLNKLGIEVKDKKNGFEWDIK